MLFKVLGRVFGGFFRGIGRGLVGFFRWTARHEALLGVFMVIVFAVVAVWVVLGLLNINVVFGDPPTAQAPIVAAAAVASPTAEVAPSPLAAATPAPVAKTNAPAATEAFMVGQVNGNAEQVWEAMAVSLHTKLAGEGRDKTYYQRFFDAQKKSGFVFEGYQYIGGVQNDNGTSLHFYVLSVVGSDKKVNRVPYSFILDKEGKIVEIPTDQ